jgi:hypothetical protein
MRCIPIPSQSIILDNANTLFSSDPSDPESASWISTNCTLADGNHHQYSDRPITTDSTFFDDDKTFNLLVKFAERYAFVNPHLDLFKLPG